MIFIVLIQILYVYVTVMCIGWYLDQQTPEGDTHYLIEDTWMNFYLNEPFKGDGWTAEYESMVLGGEASMWGEQVDDRYISLYAINLHAGNP